MTRPHLTVASHVQSAEGWSAQVGKAFLFHIVSISTLLFVSICSSQMLSEVALHSLGRLLWFYVLAAVVLYLVGTMRVVHWDGRVLRQTFSLNRNNRSMIHIQLGAFSMTLILFLFLNKHYAILPHGLKASVERWEELLTSVLTSMTAAAAYGIMETWRVVHKRFYNRSRLLKILGIKELEFDKMPPENRKVIIVLPRFTQLQTRKESDASIQHKPSTAKHEASPTEQTSDTGTTRLTVTHTSTVTEEQFRTIEQEIQLHIDTVVHKEFNVAQDVLVFQKLTQILQECDILWEIQDPLVLMKDLGIDLNRRLSGDDIQIQLRSAMEKLASPYISIGLYSNALTMVVNTIMQKEGYFYIKAPMPQAMKGVFYVGTTGDFPNSTTHEHTTGGVYMRRNFRNGSVFVIGGLVAEATQAMGRDFVINWGSRLYSTLNERGCLSSSSPGFIQILPLSLDVMGKLACQGDEYFSNGQAKAVV